MRGRDGLLPVLGGGWIGWWVGVGWSGMVCVYLYGQRDATHLGPRGNSVISPILSTQAPHVFFFSFFPFFFPLFFPFFFPFVSFVSSPPPAPAFALIRRRFTSM